MKHIAVVAIFGLIALNTILKPASTTAVDTRTQQAIDLEVKALTKWPMRRTKREHMGKAQSFIDLILKIMNSLQFGKPNMAKNSQSELRV